MVEEKKVQPVGGGGHTPQTPREDDIAEPSPRPNTAIFKEDGLAQGQGKLCVKQMKSYLSNAFLRSQKGHLFCIYLFMYILFIYNQRRFIIIIKSRILHRKIL